MIFFIITTGFKSGNNFATQLVMPVFSIIVKKV